MRERRIELLRRSF